MPNSCTGKTSRGRDGSQGLLGNVFMCMYDVEQVAVAAEGRFLQASSAVNDLVHHAT